MSHYHLIIQAGGQGTRLMGENSVFPKILKTISGKTIYEHILESLSPYGEVVVILDKKFSPWQSYLSARSKVIYSNQTGDLAGINTALDYVFKPPLFPHKVLVVWSDLLFGKNFKQNHYFHEDLSDRENVLFLLNDEKEYCRLRFQEDLQRDEDKDEPKYPFPGVFLLDSRQDRTSFFRRWLNETQNPSFDLLEQKRLENVFFNEGELTRDIIQVGTKEEFSLRNHPYSSRSFNKIHFFNSFVVKESKNRVDLQREYEWLKESYPEHSFSFSRRTFDLEMPLFIHSSKYPLLNILDGAIQSLSDLHEKKTAKYIGLEEGSLLLEHLILDKALVRLTEFEGEFPISIKKVDGVEIPSNIEERFRSLFDLILEEVGSSIEYLNFIHGDPTLSNLCLNENGSEYVWIDPRPPFFEKHKFLGFKILDWVKFYYSLSGYDKLNRYELIPRIIEGDILIDELQILEKVPEILPFPNDLLEKFMPFLWMSLAAYTIDTPIEASIAYGIAIKKLVELT